MHSNKIWTSQFVHPTSKIINWRSFILRFSLNWENSFNDAFSFDEIVFSPNQQNTFWVNRFLRNPTKGSIRIEWAKNIFSFFSFD